MGRHLILGFLIILWCKRNVTEVKVLELFSLAAVIKGGIIQMSTCMLITVLAPLMLIEPHALRPMVMECMLSFSEGFSFDSPCLLFAVTYSDPFFCLSSVITVNLLYADGPGI
jgi:hypothetical protein